MISFSKYSGAGNDFLLIDNRSNSFPKNRVKDLCCRRNGVGGDGVILLEKGREKPFLMRIFNCDGSEAEMCGNGLRAFTQFLYELGIHEEIYEIENIEGQIYQTQKAEGDDVEVRMPLVKEVKWNIPYVIEGQNRVIHFLNTGVPHAIFFVKELKNFPVEVCGKAIRHHPLFQPHGTNVNFVEVHENKVFIRTFERGVEGETLACGTGSVASALAVAYLFKFPSPVEIHVRSGAVLKISFQKEGDAFHKIMMRGPAKKVFSGLAF